MTEFRIPIYKPYLPAKALTMAHKALDSTWLSSHGPYIAEAQERFQKLLNIKHALLLNNGTSACHLLAKVSSALHHKTKVIVPNNVYVAAWNAFLFDGRFELEAIDTDPNTWNFDLKELDKAIKRSPDAMVLVVHNIGNIINVPTLQKLYPSTLFVEDNCEGFLGKYDGQYSGTASYCSATSFYGNKNITAGESGALLTNDDAVYQLAKCIQGQGQSEERFIHNELGYNYRITNIQSAILCGQLDCLDEIIEMKERIFYDYRLVLKDREDVLIQQEALNTEPANWMFGCRIPNSPEYKQAEQFFNAKGVEIRPMFYAIDKHKHIKDNGSVSWSSNTNADLLRKECLILPSYPELSIAERAYVLDTLNLYLKQLKGTK